ncbi:MAG TPA: hypothetical protein VNI52_04450 [Sphingobacteriaceae bacterium]|nr:hypothetical protein [Sphingobacteriaceae bacterium]
MSKRRVNYRSIGKDSINLHLDKDYFLIEDTCSSIVRYGHFNFEKRHFFGPFRDLNKQDPFIILAEGKYSQEGKLDGPVVLRYMNDNVQAKGRFLNGDMDGAWELFYEDGKPWMNFTATEKKIQVNDAWDLSGKKVVDGGNGEFKTDLKTLYWQGKLVNGFPDGTWRARRTNDRTNTVMSSEIFKGGSFVKGSGPLGAYSDASRIVLVNPELLPIYNASLMQVSPTACDPSMSRKNIMNATYRNGMTALSDEIIRLVNPFLGKSDIKFYNIYNLTIEGTINEKGVIESLRLKDGFDDKVTSGLIRELYKLPRLEPAIVNGQPTTQSIIFVFKFSAGTYNFSYKFLPIKV